MKSLAPIASTLLQSVYVYGLLELVVTILRFEHIQALYSAGDPKLMAGFISSTILELGITVLIGLVGVGLAWASIRKFDECPPWFLSITKFFGWAWIIFIPVGTVIGVWMLRWQKDSQPQMVT